MNRLAQRIVIFMSWRRRSGGNYSLKMNEYINECLGDDDPITLSRLVYYSNALIVFEPLKDYLEGIYSIHLEERDGNFFRLQWNVFLALSFP